MGIDYMKLIRFNTNYIKILEQRFNILHTSIVNNMFEHIYSEYLQVFENDDHAILSVMDRKKKKLVRDAREYHEERVYLLSTRNTDLNSNHRVNLDTRYQAPAENSRPPTRTSPRLAAKWEEVSDGETQFNKQDFSLSPKASELCLGFREGCQEGEMMILLSVEKSNAIFDSDIEEQWLGISVANNLYNGSIEIDTISTSITVTPVPGGNIYTQNGFHIFSYTALSVIHILICLRRV